MQTEIEAKFLGVNHDDLRVKLKALGATLEQPLRLMRRAILDYPDSRLQSQDNSWLRVRDEGDKTTVTFKQVKEHSFGEAHEIEMIVSSFEAAKDIFVATGLEVQSYQENRRETWQLRDVEVVLDEWPWLDPYIEIEGPSKEAVMNVADELGFAWDTAVFGTVIAAYRTQYPAIGKDEDVSRLARITFDLPRPDWFTGTHTS